MDSSWNAILASAGQKYNVDPALISTALNMESGGAVNVSDSPTGNQGPFQLSKLLQKRYGVKDPHDPVQSADAAAQYLSEGLDKTGSAIGALGYYHAGPDPGQWGPKTNAYMVKGAATYKMAGNIQPDRDNPSPDPPMADYAKQAADIEKGWAPVTSSQNNKSQGVDPYADAASAIEKGWASNTQQAQPQSLPIPPVPPQNQAPVTQPVQPQSPDVTIPTMTVKPNALSSNPQPPSQYQIQLVPPGSSNAPGLPPVNLPQYGPQNKLSGTLPPANGGDVSGSFAGKASDSSFLTNTGHGIIQGIKSVANPIVDTIKDNSWVKWIDEKVPALGEIDRRFSTNAKDDAEWEKNYGNTIGGMLGKAAGQAAAVAPALMAIGPLGVAATDAAAGSMTTPSLQYAITTGGDILNSVVANLTAAKLTGNDLGDAAKMGVAMPFAGMAVSGVANSVAKNWGAWSKAITGVVPGLSSYHLGLESWEVIGAVLGGASLGELAKAYTQPIVNGAAKAIRLMNETAIPSGLGGEASTFGLGSKLDNAFTATKNYLNKPRSEAGTANKLGSQ